MFLWSIISVNYACRLLLVIFTRMPEYLVMGQEKGNIGRCMEREGGCRGKLFRSQVDSKALPLVVFMRYGASFYRCPCIADCRIVAFDMKGIEKKAIELYLTNVLRYETGQN